MAKLSSDGTYVTVEKGDYLIKIANQYGNGKTYKELAAINNIPNPSLIYVGQKIYLGGSASQPVVTPTVTTTNMVTINQFGLQSDTDRTVFVTWEWSNTNTEHYQVIWYYDTGDSVWFVGSDSTVKEKQSIYNAPTNSLRVKVKIKPISKTRTKNGKTTTYFTANWSTEKTYSFSDNPPKVPAVPNVTIEKYKLTAELDNLDVNATSIQFQVVKNNSTVFNTGTATIITNHASYSCTVDAGADYKVRCRSVRGDLYSDWSEYSSSIATAPAAPSGITTLKATSETSVYLEWETVSNTKTYEIEYATKKTYFDGSDATTIVSGIEFNHYEKTGLESGEEYFFRVRAINDQGESPWSDIKSVTIGKDPAAPTTWSSSTRVITGEPLTLYWVHNTEDGSSQTYGELEFYIDGMKETHTIKNTEDEEEKDKTSFYVIDTSTFVEGTKIQWRVRTAGVTKVYGDWSIQRTVDIYAPPTLELSVTGSDGKTFETLTSFPFYIYGLPGPNTQVPIGYHLVLTANESYESVDDIGNVKMVNKGDTVYSKYFDISESLLVELSASHIDLENNVNYTVTCVVTMNSGLNAEASTSFTVAWTDDVYSPDLEIGIDEDTLVAYLRPYCMNEHGDLIEDISLSVYRREFDGTFVELATGLQNTENTFITDPHPALDYARYRVVAVANATGAVSYYDVPGYPVGEKAVIIQWSEDWSSFDATTEDALEKPPWSGSLLKLPYNIDVSDQNDVDVSLIKYIGRRHPVTYYGTQVGSTSSWKVEIPKYDKETLYALRRLAIWMGDVYVREPSGSGYWANISVSFSQTHCELTIPVTLNITRVEGGV